MNKSKFDKIIDLIGLILLIIGSLGLSITFIVIMYKLSAIIGTLTLFFIIFIVACRILD